MTNRPRIYPIPRFSTIYAEPTKSIPDSLRARKRIKNYYSDFRYSKSGSVNSFALKIEKMVEQAFGVTMNIYETGETTFIETDVKDFLSAITIVHRYLPPNQHLLTDDGAYISYKDAWLDICRNVFSEESLCYTIGDDGIVRYAVDEEFARNETSAIVALSDRELSAVRHEAEQAFKAIHQTPPDTKGACKHMFEAVEILFKIIFTDTKRLGSGEANTHLLPLLREMYRNDRPASDAAANIVKEVGDWANWLHIYRHGQRVEEPTPPPLEVAVLGVSAGAGYLRFLADVHSWRQAASASGALA